MSLSAIPGTLRGRVFDRDAGRCRYCQLKQFGQGAVFHINHVVPRSRGGATALDNLVLQCPHCSLHKADRVEASDPKTGEMVAVFHPLNLSWPEHFEMLDDATCVGLTAIGRATVHCLRMNDPIPRTARALQRMLGLLP